jgi:hypothetical protein
VRDIIAGILMFLIPPGAAFFVHEKYDLNPRGTIVFTALMAAMWVLTVVACYFVGRKPNWRSD